MPRYRITFENGKHIHLRNARAQTLFRAANARPHLAITAHIFNVIASQLHTTCRITVVANFKRKQGWCAVWPAKGHT